MNPPKNSKYFIFLMKVLFIYSKLEEGWIVKKLESGKYECKRFIDGEESTMNWV